MGQTFSELRGRPPATTHAEIEQAAFALFAEHGFEATTVEMIAAELGIGRRTVSRYYPSKNDIPWGQFDLHLAGFRRLLDAQSVEPMWRAIHQAVMEFNRFPPDASPPHRERMLLIRNTPALVAHSALRYDAWRRVISEYVADREGLDPDDLLPRTVAHLALAVVLSAYDTWLDDPRRDLEATIDEAMQRIRAFVSAS